MQGFGFTIFQIHLPLLGGFLGIHARLQAIFFHQDISPATLAVFRTLLLFEAAYGSLRTRASLDNCDHPGGFIGAYVMSDECVASGKFVTCQEDSLAEKNSRKEIWVCSILSGFRTARL